jgi:hypothetical protein
MDKVQPEVTLKHDPTARLNLEKVVANEKKAKEQMHPHCANDLQPRHEDNLIPQDQHEQNWMIAEQQLIQHIIQLGGEQALGAVAALGDEVGLIGPCAYFDRINRDIDYKLPPRSDQLLHKMYELHRQRHFRKRQGQLQLVRAGAHANARATARSRANARAAALSRARARYRERLRGYNLQLERAIRHREELQAMQQVRLPEIQLPGVAPAAVGPLAIPQDA